MKRLAPHQHFKLAAIVFCCLITIAILSTTALYVPRIGKVAVITKYAPYTASVYLNGAKIRNNATNFLAPGKYELTVQLDHFTTNTETITITKDTTYLIGFLFPSDATGETIADQHKRDFQEVEGVFGQLVIADGDQIRQKYPILDFLPINNPFYSISFTYKNDGSPKITVQTEPNMADVAVRKLLSLPNIALIDYDISFAIPNPFTTPMPNTNTSPATFIKASFPNIIDDYQIADGQHVGDYFLTTIYLYDFTSHDSYAHFKVILSRQNDSWVFAAPPQLLFTTKNAPSTPIDLLNQANQL